MTSILLLIETLLLVVMIYFILKIKLNISITTSLLTTISFIILYIFIICRILGDFGVLTDFYLIFSDLFLLIISLIIILADKELRNNLFNKTKNFLLKIKNIKNLKLNLKSFFKRIKDFDILLLCLFFTFIIICISVPITAPNMLFQDLVVVKWIVENGSLPPLNVPYLIQKNNPYFEFFTGGVFQIVLTYTYIIGGDFLLRSLNPVVAIISIMGIYKIATNLGLKLKRRYLVFGIILSPIFIHFSTILNSDLFIIFFTTSSLLILSEIISDKNFTNTSILLTLGITFSVLSFAVKFYGLISIYLCYLFYWRQIKEKHAINKHPFKKDILLSVILPLIILTLVFERNLNYTANLLPPYTFLDLPIFLYNVPAIILAIIFSSVIFCLIIVVSFYELKIKYSRIIWWSLLIITYVVGLILVDPSIFPSFLKLALFSFHTGDITTTFGPYVLFIILYFILLRSKFLNKISTQFKNYTRIIARGFALIILSQVIVLQHFSEGPIRYSFTMLFMLVPAVAIVLQLFIEQFNYPKDEHVKRVKFVKITRKTTKQLLRIGYGLAILYMFLGGSLGYLNPPGYLFISPFKSDYVDLQHWRPYVANAINYINENMSSDEYALFTDPYVYLFDNPLNILTFTPNPEHRNRVIYERIRSYGDNITTEDLIGILVEFRIRYFVTALGYSLDLLVENTPIIGEMLNLTISPMVFYEKDTTTFSAENRYAAIWLFNY